mgnify:FL=1
MAKKITNIGNEETKALLPEIKEALQRVLNKYGLKVEQSGKAGYGGHNLRIKYEITVPAQAVKNAQKDFDSYKVVYGIDADVPFGFTFQVKGETYTVTGLNHKAPKNRIILKTASGGAARCPVSTLNSQYKFRKVA